MSKKRIKIIEVSQDEDNTDENLLDDLLKELQSGSIEETKKESKQKTTEKTKKETKQKETRVNKKEQPAQKTTKKPAPENKEEHAKKSEDKHTKQTKSKSKTKEDPCGKLTIKELKDKEIEDILAIYNGCVELYESRVEEASNTTELENLEGEATDLESKIIEAIIKKRRSGEIGGLQYSRAINDVNKKAQELITAIERRSSKLKTQTARQNFKDKLRSILSNEKYFNPKDFNGLTIDLRLRYVANDNKLKVLEIDEIADRTKERSEGKRSTSSRSRASRVRFKLTLRDFPEVDYPYGSELLSIILGTRSNQVIADTTGIMYIIYLANLIAFKVRKQETVIDGTEAYYYNLSPYDKTLIIPIGLYRSQNLIRVWSSIVANKDKDKDALKKFIKQLVLPSRLLIKNVQLLNAPESETLKYPFLTSDSGHILSRSYLNIIGSGQNLKQDFEKMRGLYKREYGIELSNGLDSFEVFRRTKSGKPIYEDVIEELGERLDDKLYMDCTSKEYAEKYKIVYPIDRLDMLNCEMHRIVSEYKPSNENIKVLYSNSYPRTIAYLAYLKGLIKEYDVTPYLADTDFIAEYLSVKEGSPRERKLERGGSLPDTFETKNNIESAIYDDIGYDVESSATATEHDTLKFNLLPLSGTKYTKDRIKKAIDELNQIIRIQSYDIKDGGSTYYGVITVDLDEYLDKADAIGMVLDRYRLYLIS